MSPPLLPRNVETVSFFFCLDTKWQNVAPVGWFNSNTRASLPCQGADWKWQSLLGFNQKRQRFQCDISDSKVWELRVCLGWRWAWSLGCHLGGSCVFYWFICFLLLERSMRKRPGGKDRHSLLPLSPDVWDLQGSWQVSVMWGDPKGSDALAWLLSRNFSQERRGADGTYSPWGWALRAGEGSAGISWPHKSLLLFGVRLRPAL